MPAKLPWQPWLAVAILTVQSLYKQNQTYQ